MIARELMTRQFDFVHADASVEEVARKLERNRIDSLLVCRDGCLVGLISQTEIQSREAPPRRTRGPTRVVDLVPPDVVYCFENTDITEAAILMKENRIGLLPVLGPSKHVVGMLSLKDIPADPK